jgi:hypothetical protein
LAYCCLACSSPALGSCLLAALHRYYTCAGFSLFIWQTPCLGLHRQCASRHKTAAGNSAFQISSCHRLLA